ncbi:MULTISPECIES: acetyl-CoA carboxylase biotin carboxyl carrier protein [Mammaliicoccus]|uniref:Biotin carboxyl carrier protein of acetyl-CoA carboxylase n=3 Tax=Mammaliicoccus vitulinus TaxID=71237 RepID=A0A2T4PSR7_9STAP|nr:MULTISPECIES: acetyl-CoA carboxylase biotin carboxyl carrier protein [Mammaliicoccus]MBM6628164.1 acetyl-CoA carboxylase biotin carboxyl carrier protein [Mammaliicoccus vitulinus]MBO3077189.1 acetyl-CoA carboxylase biotin carboxyl carrier protein [Mammaliicoccus vitulinus]MEB7656857.1 acetyl-CoA carboxylase biotin carboxyl carrier protein [Mammaliicoccus vitulinus]PTI29373.1 acetyl-CoA carboxylase biotin carboxyl carrier protein [Mammaliicoccus vitulinus]PTI72621.1 acetyl-CoA carboxylase bi
MNLKQIKELVDILDNSSLTEIDINDKDFKLTLKKDIKQEIIYSQGSSNVIAEQQPQQTPQQNVEPEAPTGLTINAPMVGTFYKSPSPDEGPYVQVGSHVDADTTVCILEAMKLFNEIQAEVSGEITEILVEDGQMVEYGQPLFKVK